MPRRPNPNLEERILNAAQKLWKKGGEKALTMRAVAAAAGTNTPAVYRRFRDRGDLLRRLLQCTRTEIADELEKGATVEEACEKYLDYAVKHPWEYELLYQYDYRLDQSLRSRGQFVERPARDVMKRKLREWLGGSPENHERMLTATWMLAHGASMLIIDKMIPPEQAAEARKVFTASVKALLREAEFIRKFQ
ncbi:MAG: helix-turn-helix domain-containing protein [Candidatus Sulfotelmatobacter sp.]